MVAKRSSAANGWCLDGKTAAAPREVELESEILIRAVGVWLGDDGFIAPAEHTLPRTEGLPGEAIDREAVDHAVADHVAAQAPARILLVTVAAGEVELAAPSCVFALAGVKGGGSGPADIRVKGHAL